MKKTVSSRKDKVFIKADKSIKFSNIRVSEIGYILEKENYEYSSNRNAYVLHFVFSGICSVGDCPLATAPIGFLLTPNEPHRYSVKITPEHPKCEHYWVVFGGKSAKCLLEDACFPKRSSFFEFKNPALVKTLFDEFFMAYREGVNGEFLMLSLLFELFHTNYNDQERLPKEYDEKEKYVLKAIEFIEQNYSKQITVYDIAQRINISSKYMYRLFKRYTGTSPSEFLNRYRITKAQTLLLRTEKSVSSISELVGYKDISYFNRVFKKYSLGVSPSAFRRQALSKNVTISE